MKVCDDDADEEQRDREASDSRASRAGEAQPTPKTAAADDEQRQSRAAAPGGEQRAVTEPTAIASQQPELARTPWNTDTAIVEM